MSFLPISVRVEGCRCVVVGTDAEAARRVQALIDAGAGIVVIGAAGEASFEALCRRHANIERRRRAYRAGDLEGATLAFVCGPGVPVEAVRAEATQRGLALNVADDAASSTFIMPAIHRQGAVVVAVSTGGASPALARRVRDEIAALVGPEYGSAAEVLAELRARFARGTERARAFTRLLEGGLVEALRSRDGSRVERLTERAEEDLHRGARTRAD